MEPNWNQIRHEKDQGFARGAAFNKAVDVVIAKYKKGDVNESMMVSAIKATFEALLPINQPQTPPETHQNAPQQAFSQNSYQAPQQWQKPKYSPKDLDMLHCSICAVNSRAQTIVWSTNKNKPYCKNWKTHKEKGEFAKVEGGDRVPNDYGNDPQERNDQIPPEIFG